MNSVQYVIVLLSEQVETLRAVEELLLSDNGEFSVLWIDLKQSPNLDELPPCDAYLSDASCQYLLDHQAFVRGHCFFWLVNSAVEQVELLHLGATDCFLWTEFNGSLLRHCLRLTGRNKQVTPSPLDEFQGDRFQTLIQNIPGAVYRCLHTETWQGMYISDAIAGIVGYPAADFSPEGDRTFASVIYPEDLAFVDQVIDSHIRSRCPYALEYRLIHRDGSVRWVEEKGQGVFDEAGNLLWIDGVIFEITEHKQFVERLERQQKNYYEKTPAMLHAINGQGEIVAVSDRWLQVMGYQREEVLGRQSTDFLTTQSRQYATTQMLPLFREQGYIEEVEYQFVKKDGQVIDVLLSAILDDSTHERRSLSVLTDVTARNQLTVQLNAYQNRLQSLVRRRTQALASSEARLRTLFNLLPLGIMEVDLDGRFRFVNHQFAQMVGRQELDLLGCHVTEVTYGEDLEKTKTILAQLQRGEIQVFSVDKRYLRGSSDDPDAYFWGHLRVTAVRNGQGKIDYLIAIVEDIHERKLMEESLRKSEARLARSQAIAKVGAWEWDVRQDETYWSKESYEMFGYEPFSFTPNAQSFMNSLHPDDRVRMVANIEKALNTGEIEATSEYRIIRPDGQVRIIQDHHEILWDEAGEVVFLAGATIDITEERAMVAALKASEARLAKSQAIAKVGSWEWNFKTNKLSWSDEMFRLCDLEPQSVEPTYEMFLAKVKPSDVPKIEAMMARVYTGEKTSEVEYRLISAQGSEKTLLAIAETHHNSSGEVEYITGSAQDVTISRQATLALQSSEARLAKAQAIAKIGVWEWDQRTDQLVWSQEFYRLLALEPDSIEPSFAVFFEMVDPGDRPRIDAAIERLRAGEPIHNFEYRLNTATGQKIVVEHVDAIKNDQGEVTHFSGTLQDVTAFRRAIIALQESETRFRELVERIDESFWINPANPTHVSYVSPAYERIWGRSCESLLADGSSWIESVHPDHRPQIVQAMEIMAAGGRFNEEYRIIRPDGTVRWVHARSSQIYDEAGNILRHVGVVTDITERKWAELNLRASEARFRGIFDQAALGIAQINLAGQFILVNQAFCDLIDYHHTELEQMTWQQITHPDDLEVCAEDIARILRGDIKSAVIEKRYVHKQGYPIWIKAIASFIYDAEGQPQYLLGLVEDITEYKAAAAQLAQTQHRYQDLVDGVHGIIYQYSTKRGGIFYSSRLKEILGYEVDYLLAHSSLWYDSIHPEDLPKVDQAIANLHQQQQFVVEYRIRDAAGNWRWFSDKSFRIEQQADDAEGEFIVSGLALDITERRWTDETLRHRLNLETVLAEISRRMLLQTELDLPDILQLLGQTFQADRMSVMLCQPHHPNRVERLVSWAATVGLELDPQAFSQIDLSSYHWWLSCWQKQQPLLINREHPLPESAVLERKFLADLDIQAVMWIPIPDHQGKHWGYIECSSTDPEHRAWSREDVDLLAIAGTLIYNFWMRQKSTQQLELAKEAAEAANHAKSQFLMNMSHELRTPLNAVLGFAQIMAQSPTFPKEHRDRLDILQGSGRRLLTLLNDILDLASFDGGKATLNPVLFNLYGLLDDLKHMFQHLIHNKSLDFTIECSDDLPRYIVADQAKLHSVLIHLLSNAIKFTSEGQVKLAIEVINHDPLTLRFSVTDTGVGIAEADQDKLFNDFVKLEAGDLFGQGSGLGLALSQKFILLMGSEIQVSSRPNIGSCFSFELQCAGENGLADERSPLPLPLARPNTALTREHFQTLPVAWRRQFYQAACAARAKKLEQLIDELPPGVEGMAQTLASMVQKLDFAHLIALSELPTDEPTP